MRWVECSLKALFWAANFAFAAGVAWAAVAWTLGADWRVPEGTGVAWRAVVLPVVGVQALAYSFLLLCTAWSDLQSFAAYGAPASWLALTRRANARAWARVAPAAVGLPECRVVE
eukprot:3966118-Prymnesium_polylepis.1